MTETEKLTELRKKITEYKKRLQLTVGQKRANTEEWENQKSKNLELISNLKKEIKDATQKLIYLKNPATRKPSKQPQEIIQNIEYLSGASSVNEAIQIIEEKIFKLRKKYDLMNNKYLKRKEYFDKVVNEYNEYIALKKNENLKKLSSNTSQEDTNRRHVCRLENEIHRINVQLMEAEHIKKKYISIKASLVGDEERFDKSLNQIQEALKEQQAEIRRLQEVNREALIMRDTAKMALQRQEQQANLSTRVREKQSYEFRRQVEERKIELEKIERNLFSTGKTLLQQDSIDSSFGDQQTGKIEQDEDSNYQLKLETSEMEIIFKNLMETTGAVTAEEVLERFITQKESTERLNHLRAAAEIEKKRLELQREILTNELEISTFADTEEKDVNQEEIELLKEEIDKLEKENIVKQESNEHIQKVITLIQNGLLDIIFKLQENDEKDITLPEINKTIRATELYDFLNDKASDEEIIAVLVAKINTLQSNLKLIHKSNEDDGFEEDLKQDEPYLTHNNTSRQTSVLEDKPPTLPACYLQFFNSRAGQSSFSMGQSSQLAVTTDDESEIPSRNFIKEQALLIVDTKSRRKGYRGAATQRRK